MPIPAERLFSGRLRLLQYVSDACVLFACVSFAVIVGKSWAWGPFIASPLIAAAGFIATALVVRAGRHAMALTPEELLAAEADARLRGTVTIPGYATIGIGCGVIAGSVQSYWPDVFLAASMLVVGVALPLGMLPALKRRATRRGAASGDG
jgi:hypothetical protein